MLTEDLVELWADQWLGAVDGAQAGDSDFICFCGRSLEGTGFGRHANAIYDLVSPEAIDGLVVWTSTLGINVGGERVEEFCRRFAPMPIVSVEQPLGQAPVVRMDNRGGMRMAVAHLVEVHGRRRIAFIRGPATHDGANERYQGYLDALSHAGLSARPEYVSPPPPSWHPQAAAAAVRRMLAEAEPPDAIVAANDHLAMGVLSALADAGIRAPEEVAVVGFDDSLKIRTHDLWFEGGSEETEDTRRTITVGANDSGSALPLTTVHAPFREMGRQAVDLVLGLLRGESVPRAVNVSATLVVRRSCGCFPDLRDAAAGASAHLPDDWFERLMIEFKREVHGESTDVFLGLLAQFVQTSLRHREKAANWSHALITLRRLVEDPATGGPAAARAEDLWLRAQILVNETVERQWRYAQVLTEKRNKVLREVGQRLITAPDIDGLTDVLAAELPKAAIPGCYLAAYDAPASATDPVTGVVHEDAPRDRSRLLLAYEDGARVELDGTPTFNSVQLVPDGRLDRPTPYSMVAVPLYLADEQLGFGLFELGPRIGWIYAALREQLSAAVHRAMMVERERRAHAAVLEAHRREERHRLAGELHDSVSQALFSMTLHTRAMQLAMQQGDGDGRVARGLAELRDLTQSALTDMRSLIFQLRPDVLRTEGLVAAIRTHASAVAAREELDVRVDGPQERLPLDERAEEELLRVVQEALHNTVKHARANRVDIRLSELPGAPGTLMVEVADDGIGFDADVPRPGHIGLETMRERAQRIGGHFTVDSSRGGSTVRAVIPDILRRPPATVA